MIRVLPVEIREFSSINELDEFLEKEIAWYQALLEEYGETLGSLLRGQGLSSEEVEKILKEKGFSRPVSRKGKKGRSASPSEGWFSYKGLLFSADKQGRIEMLFESIEKIENAINRIKETRTLIEELQKAGFGLGLSFSVYLLNGVPERIFVQKAKSAAQKYKLELFLSTSMTPAPKPSKIEEAENKSEESQEKSGKEEGAGK